MKETSDLWRLYRREWVTVHTITMSSPEALPVAQAAEKWVEDNLRGRVRDEDIAMTVHTDHKLLFWVDIKVFKDNLKGEFKYVEAAQVHANQSGWEEYVIVPRNSKSDHDLRNYGVVKL